MEMDAPTRRILVGTLAFLVVGIAASLGRGQGLGFVSAFAVAVVVGAGLVLAAHRHGRRQP